MGRERAGAGSVVLVVGVAAAMVWCGVRDDLRSAARGDVEKQAAARAAESAQRRELAAREGERLAVLLRGRTLRTVGEARALLGPGECGRGREGWSLVWTAYGLAVVDGSADGCGDASTLRWIRPLATPR